MYKKRRRLVLRPSGVFTVFRSIRSYTLVREDRVEANQRLAVAVTVVERLAVGVVGGQVAVEPVEANIRADIPVSSRTPVGTDANLVEVTRVSESARRQATEAAIGGCS